MKTTIFTFLLLILINQSFSGMIEGHKECEVFNQKIEQLNRDESPYYRYQVFPNYRYEEDKDIPTCQFTKTTSGGISLKIEISDKTTFVEVNKKLQNLEMFISALTESENMYCSLGTEGFSLISDRKSKGDKFSLTFYGNLYCLSENNLNTLQTLDVEALLRSATLGTDIKFEIDPEAMPSISGTTIHN